jgi:hypothetical protein
MTRSCSWTRPPTRSPPLAEGARRPGHLLHGRRAQARDRRAAPGREHGHRRRVLVPVAEAPGSSRKVKQSASGAIASLQEKTKDAYRYSLRIMNRPGGTR